MILESKEINFIPDDEINPAFYKVWTTDKPYNILNGGRNSFKSSTISLKIVKDMIEYISEDKFANVIILRKTAATIRDSVFMKIKWALGKYGILHEFRDYTAPFKWVHTATGSTIYFYGQDDFEKLKSSAVGNVIAVWYEEASEFKNVEEFDQTNITFMRQSHPDEDFVKFYWSYNPPRSPYSWINKWAEECKAQPDYLVHTSTYLDDTLDFVTPQMLADIERIKENDYDYYRYIYLGEPVGLGTNVYNYRLFNIVDKMPDDERISYLLYSTDSGHQQSATTTVCAAITSKQNLYVLDTFYYSPLQQERKKAPSELSVAIHEFEKATERKYGRPIYKRTIDSAEGALRNQYYLDFSERLNPVNKGKKVDMIDYVVSLLAQGRIYVIDNESNEIFLEQHRDYRWDEKTIFTEDPQVVKEDDHTCDALQYLVKDNLRELNLIW